MKSRILKVSALALLACGCSNKQVASRYVTSVRVSASDGAAITVSASQEPTLAGTQLLIPPHALPADTTITLELGSTNIVTPGNTAVGPVAIWGPSGLKFNQPVQMILPIRLGSQSATNLFVQVQEDDGSAPTDIGHSHLAINAAGGTVEFPVQGFTSFQPGASAGNSCNTDSDCQAGDICERGSCQAADDGGTSCSSNADCPAGQICTFFATGNDAGVRTTGSMCVQPGNDGGILCQADSDCPAGDVCINGACEFGGSDAGCNCAQNNCAPPPNLCGAAGGQVSCDPTSGMWFCSVDGGSPDGGCDCSTGALNCPPPRCFVGQAVCDVNIWVCPGSSDAGCDCNSTNCAPPPGCSNPVCDASGIWACSGSDGGSAPDGGIAGVCTFGQDQTCNENVGMNGLAGVCNPDGSCSCNTGFAIDPSTGLCISVFSDGGTPPSDAGSCVFTGSCTTNAECCRGLCSNGMCQ